MRQYELKKLLLLNGKCPFQLWFDELTQDDQLMIESRFLRVRLGNFGDSRNLGQGLWELKFHRGAGLRIYFCHGKLGEIILIAGGQKRGQASSIRKAKDLHQFFCKGELKYGNY